MIDPKPNTLSNNLEAREAGFDVYFAGLAKGVDEARVSIPPRFANAFIDGWALGNAYRVAIRRLNK